MGCLAHTGKMKISGRAEKKAENIPIEGEPPSDHPTWALAGTIGTLPSYT